MSVVLLISTVKFVTQAERGVILYNGSMTKALEEHIASIFRVEEISSAKTDKQ
jgi:hypothetical protein